MIEFNCQCGVRLRLEDAWAGKQGKCPQCGGVLRIPYPSQPVARQPAAAAGPPSVPPARAGGVLQPLAWSPYRLAAAGSVVAVAIVGFAVYLALPDGSQSEEDSGEQQSALADATQGNVSPRGPAPVEEGRTEPSTVTRSAPADGPAARPASPPDDGLEESTKGASGENPAPATGVAAGSQLERQPSLGSPDGSGGNQAAAPVTTGLSGVSSQYDDLHCQRIQYEFGIRIPAAATILEVNGDRLPLANLAELQESVSPVLLLPRGVHAVRFRPGERPVQVTVDGDLLETYADMRRFFDLSGSIRTDELLSRSARALDVHQAPFLLNFLGATDAASGQWEAAERKFRRSLRVNPTFGPAHLNLAHCLLRRYEHQEAVRQIQLAEVFNVGNVFGLAPAIAQLRQQAGLMYGPWQMVEFHASVYVSSESLSVEDERLVALLQAVSKYAVRAEDRGKILNNLAVHFAESGRTELALEHFRSALAALKTAGPDRFQLARQVFSHMETACRQAGFTEAEQYQWMQQSVLP